jgi:probable addiction module antidote protein
VPRSTSKITKPARRSSAKRASLRRATVGPSRVYDEWLIGRLKEPKEAAAYLEAAIEDGDQGVLMLALRHVAQAQGGVAEIARRSNLTREATYRILSEDGNPELKSFIALLSAAGLRLSVKPMQQVKLSKSSRRNPVLA